VIISNTALLGASAPTSSFNYKDDAAGALVFNVEES